MTKETISRMKVSIMQAAQNYERSIRFENSMLVDNWVQRYLRMTEDTIAAARIREFSDEQIETYRRGRESSMADRKQAYSNRLESTIEKRVQLYIIGIKSAYLGK